MKVNKKDLPMIILSGIFGTCLFHLFTVFSVTEIGANLSSLLYGFAAVFALTIDCTVRHRPLTKLSVASIIVSLVGVYILMGINFSDLASTNFKGYALCLAAIICWVVENAYTVVIGTVAGDLHDIGKNILSVYFESKGYQVINIGVDVTPEAFEKAVRKYHPQVLAMSASLTTTLPSMQKCMEHLEKKGLQKNMRVIVGGAPVTKQFAQQLNADFYADNAKEALQWLLENFII